MHGEHVSSVDSPVALEKEPAGHGVIVIVSGQKNPSGHERGASDPGGQKFPSFSGQSVHVAAVTCQVLAENVPSSHGTNVEVSGQCPPPGHGSDDVDPLGQ